MWALAYFLDRNRTLSTPATVSTSWAKDEKPTRAMSIENRPTTTTVVHHLMDVTLLLNVHHIRMVHAMCRLLIHQVANEYNVHV